jgi:hypothetical protein
MLLAISGQAQVKDDPELNLRRVIEDLQAIREQREEQFRDGLRKRIQEIASHAGSPVAVVDYYEDAIRATEFEGRPKDSTEYDQWRDKRKEVHLDATFKQALMLHIEYLVLTLDRVNGRTLEESITALTSYYNRLGQLRIEIDKMDAFRTDAQKRHDDRRASEIKGKGRDVIKSGDVRKIIDVNLDNSPFVKWHRLGGYLAQVKDWEMNSGNLDGMLDKSIMPYLREKKDPSLLLYWDERIARGQVQAEKSKLAADIDKFNTETKPRLLWSKAQDTLLLGMKNRAANEMLLVITTHPSHPNFDQWSATLLEQLQSMTTKADPAAPSSGPSVIAPLPLVPETSSERNTAVAPTSVQ